MNTPITSLEVQALPKGFTVTGEYPNRHMRRSGFTNPSGGNRANNNARSTQLIQGTSLTVGKRIIHNYLAIKLMLARLLPVWGKGTI